MAQFDVYRTKRSGLVIDCQSDILEDLNSRFIVPLRPEAATPILFDRFNPRFHVAGKPFRMATQFARTIELTEIAEPILSLAIERYAIKAALDFLTDGY